MVTIIIWITQRVQSPGPLFHKQVRAGIQNRRFTIYKFRTMRPDDERIVHQASDRDDRIYPLGRFFRKFSIDEIPQFWNVLRGEMSIVGPRPCLPAEFVERQTMARMRSEQLWRDLRAKNDWTGFLPALEGVAGAGKTTALSAVRDAAEREGYRVEGFAPTSRAALRVRGFRGGDSPEPFGSAANGTNGVANGSAANCINTRTLSSPAVLLRRSRPQWVHRWISTQRPSPRTVTAIGSMPPEQSAFRSPGTLRSRCRDHRQAGQ